jgi:hypothetical protein
MNQMMTAVVSIFGTLFITSLYGLASTAVRKRVTVRSPEARAIEQMAPAVNALMEANSPMMHGIIAILEAQKGECNGNVDKALELNREAKSRFDRFLMAQAKVEGIN